MFIVSIFTEGGPGKGYGHLSRCLALAEAFAEKGHHSKIICDGPEDLRNFLKPFPVVFGNWVSNLEFCDGALHNTDIAVFDSYRVAATHYQAIAGMRNIISVYFDDTNRIAYPPGFIVNGVPGGEGAYTTVGKNDSMVLIGPEFQALRRIFWDLPPKVVYPKLRKIFLAMGGDDIRGLAPTLYHALSTYFPDLKLDILTTIHSRTTKALQELVSSDNRLLVDPTQQEVLQAMMGSDLSISAAGQTTFELLRAGLPPILIQVADNQALNLSYWNKSGVVGGAYIWNDAELIPKILNTIGELKGVSIREAIAVKAQAKVDGQGARRIVQKVCRSMV